MKHPDARIEALLVQLAHPKLATIDLSLDRVTALLNQLGNPHNKLPPVIHVAGTNGKGSLIAYLTAIFQAAGYRVHRYISPHLIQFNERIMLADTEISDAALLPLLERIVTETQTCPVTFFEATTAAAFLAFSETPADVVLLETGLGGRLDATNMVSKPLLTAITPISLDHTEYLGNSIQSIAAEKAGILKNHVPCVVGKQPEEAQIIIERKANYTISTLWQYGKNWSVKKSGDGFIYQGKQRLTLPKPNLGGEHQLLNAGTAIACTEQLTGFAITQAHITRGITHASWPARLQRLSAGSLAQMLPKNAELWLDGGHNPGAGVILADWVQKQQKPVHLICGMLDNKDIKQFLAPLAGKVKSLIAIPVPDEVRGQAQVYIAEVATTSSIKSHFAPDVKSAIQFIVKEYENDFIILICGSLYLAGDILWQNNQAHEKGQ